MEVKDLCNGDLFILDCNPGYVYEVVDDLAADTVRIKEVARKIDGKWKTKSACDIENCNGYATCRKVEMIFA